MKTLLPAFLLFSAVAVQAQHSGNNYHLDKDFPVSNGGTVSLISGDARVFISGSNRTTAHVKIDHEIVTKGLTFGVREFSFDIKNEGGNLELREVSHNTSGTVGYSSEKYTIRLELPAGVNLSVKGDDGHYQISNLAGSINLTTDDAETELTGCTGSQFVFSVNDGNITMDQGKGSITVDGDDANVTIGHGAFTDVHADVKDGRFVLETSLSEAGTYSIRSRDGSVSLGVLNGSGGNFTIRHDDGSVSTQGNFTVVEKSEDETRLTLPDGKAKVEIRVDDASVRLMARR